MRINTASPGGRPQNVSFVPLEKTLDCTVNANQLVLLRLVVYSGITRHVFVPEEVNPRLAPTDRPRILMLGGAEGSTVKILPCMLNP